MDQFAERTGLTSSRPQRRYLWTDALAVCNFLALERVDLARALIDRVHHVLGRHRDDDPRRGWISGLPEREGEAHPTAGGLRIGKALPEREAGEPISERLEWDRDGQYFHYLTKWMHALDITARATGDARYAAWARELYDVARQRFVHGHYMVWKMSIDLSRPQVASMGQHDALDGYIMGIQLGRPCDVFRTMVDPEALATADPLGLGGLLVDAHRLALLGRDPQLREDLLAAARIGLRAYRQWPDHALPVGDRLAFRELGLAIGLHAEPLDDALRDDLLRFWLHPLHWGARWREHEDINEVTLATALMPHGFLGHIVWEVPETHEAAHAMQEGP
jgi:hypothetical protein